MDRNKILEELGIALAEGEEISDETLAEFTDGKGDDEDE